MGQSFENAKIQTKSCQQQNSVYLKESDIRMFYLPLLYLWTQYDLFEEPVDITFKISNVTLRLHWNLYFKAIICYLEDH